MNWRIDCKGWRLYVALTHSVQVEGVNSKLPDGRHFLMWDFDNKEEKDVKNSLISVQRRFKLSRIFLVNTGLPNFYHAYCFRALEYPKVLEILASTEYLDQVYFKIGVIRGYFTLRYSKKRGRDFLPAKILQSKVEEDVDPYTVASFTTYWTKRL